MVLSIAQDLQGVSSASSMQDLSPSLKPQGVNNMKVSNLYDIQKEELIEKLCFCNTSTDVEEVCFGLPDWTFAEVVNWQGDVITDEMLEKAFGWCDFTCDDFFCTAGKYDEYPDKD